MICVCEMTTTTTIKKKREDNKEGSPNTSLNDDKGTIDQRASQKVSVE